MSDVHNDRNRRVEHYVRGAADDETVRRTEIEMLEDEALFDRIQTEDLFKRGLEETERRACADEHERESKTAPPARLGWALAASFCAVTILLGVYSLQLKERIDALQAPSVGVPVVTLFEQRSVLPEPTDPAAHLAGQQGPVLLEIDVSGYAHESFQLELVRDQGSLIWERQVPDERGYLTVMAPNAQTLKTIKVLSPNGEVLKSYALSKE